MNNLPKIKKLSKNLSLLISAMLVVIPLYYVIYWAFINSLPETLITKNIASAPLAPHPLSSKLRIIGFLLSLPPLSALIYGLINIRRLFSFYRQGVIFSFEHVNIFKNTSKALVWWVFLSMCYESVKSILFSMGNPPGQRIVSITFSSPEITTLVVAGIVFVIAQVMDEGRILTEEQRLIV